MAERGHPKSPDIMLRGCDPAKLEALLAQFISPEMEFKTRYVFTAFCATLCNLVAINLAR
jgi:hypothetical protein